MYIETIPNRNSPPAVLLREGYREGGKIIKRTLANLSHWDAQLVEHFRLLLKGGVAVESPDAVMTIERTLPHGHVAAVLGAARASGAQAWFGSAPQELQPVLLAMLVRPRDLAGLQVGHAPLAARRHRQLLAGPRAGGGPVQCR